jgi:alkaline phosphatase
MAKKTTGNYVDGFVFRVPKGKVAAYKKMALMGKRAWMKHGALDYKECMGEDLAVKSQGGMKPLSFGKLTKAKKSETIWFSFIVFKSRAHRDAVNKKVVKEMAKQVEKWEDMPMPFDPSQMAYGGFKVEV